MGTEVHCKSHVPGYYSMRDINEDSNSSSWSLIYGGDRNLLNGQYCNNGFMPRTVTDGYPGYEKDVLKQKMLEHEAIFKNQVYELHRLYRVQRDMMEEVKKKEVYKQRISIEASSSSSHLPSSQMPCDEAKNWHIPSFPLPNPGWVRPPILGTSEGTDSPLSCTKGNSTRVPCSSKDYGLSDSRPSKVRKKLFDLQLPADEYIDDTEEGQQIRDTNISDVSSYHPTGNHRLAPDNGVKLFLGGGKTDGTTDTSSDPRLKKSHGLADLNEPIQVEETTPPLSVDFLGRSACHGEIRGLDLAAKPKSQFIDLSQEYLQNSQHGSCNGNLNNQSAANKGNTRGWLSCMYEAGNSGRDRNCVPQFLQPEQLPISSHSSQFVLDKAHQHPYIFPTDFRREEPWMERSRSYEISDRNCDNSNYNHPDSVVASRISNQYPFFNPSDAANSWSQSVTSWGKPNTSFTQKFSSVPTRPSFLSSETPRSAQPSAQTHEIFGDKWHANGISRLNPGLGGDLPIRNGFYHGSSSGSKELSANLSLIAYDNLNGNRIDVGTSENLINNGSTGLFKGSDVMDLRSRMDVNLNMVPPRNSSNEVAPPQSHEILDGKRKREDHLAVLPWLREKPVCNQLTKKETVKDPNVLCIQNVSSSSSDRDVGVKRDSGDSPSNGKLFGVPIFGKNFTSKNDTSSLVSSSASIHFPPKGEGKENEGRHKGIDINVACDLMDSGSRELMFAEALVVEKGTDTKFNNFRNIDLNSCISEEEDILGSSLASTTPKKKIALEIDLEAPVVLEPEEAVLALEEHSQEEPLQSPEHKDEHQKGDEVDRIAAEAIVDISLSCFDHPSDACLSDSLLWLADVIEGDRESKVCKGSRGRDGGDVEILEEIDEFEMMTLQLEETREEDYMPKPFVPEFQEAEETGPSSLPSRTRKGQARRGRQRRDFQRDILPGLVSLSRHEVTEDLQTFGGLMRATGHQWNGGLTRKARGRRRCVVDSTPPVVVTPECTQLTQQLNNSIEVAGLEDRSLTGWGKTTRRPRRQRCPAGNNLAVALT